MFYCNDCYETCESDSNCESCGGNNLEELGQCVNCDTLSTLDQHDRNGLCGADGLNCQEAFEDGEGL